MDNLQAVSLNHENQIFAPVLTMRGVMKAGYCRHLNAGDSIRAFFFDPGKFPLDIPDIVVIPVIVTREHEISLIRYFSVRQSTIAKTRLVRIDDNPHTFIRCQLKC